MTVPAGVCLTPVSDLQLRVDVLDALAVACDYRAAVLSGPCEEDAVCAVQVIADTGDYPGAAATVR